MKKILIIISFLFILTSCFGGTNIENENSIFENNTITENNKLYSTGVVGKLGNSEKEVVENFYSNDSEKQQNVQEWLANEENYRSSRHGDIIEFLDYCEKFKKEVKDENDFNNFLYTYSEGEYKEIFQTNTQLDKIDINKILSQQNSQDKAFSYYKKLFTDFSKNNSIDCQKYINE